MINPVSHQDLASLLQLGDASEFVDCAGLETNLPIWLLIRVSVLRTIMSVWLFKSTPSTSMHKYINEITILNRKKMLLCLFCIKLVIC